MTDQETYDRTLDAPAASAPAQPVTTLPNEEYYRRDPDPRPTGRRARLGVGLVPTGLLLLAFQVFGHGIASGGTLSLVNQTLPGNRIELSAASSDVEVRPWNQNTIHIEATQRGGSQGDYTIDVSQAGDTVRVVESSRSFFW